MSLNIHKREGSGAPGFTPTRVADHYTDTTNHVAYISINTSSSSDWLKLPGGGGTGVTDGDKGDIVVSSSGTSWLFDSSVVTAAAKTVLDDSTVAAMRATLGIKQAEVANFVIGPASHTDAAEFDYTTDGTDDEVQINAALVALPSNGGTILIRDGTYNLGDFISVPSNCTIILGPGCVIKPENSYVPTSQTLATLTVHSYITNSDHSSGNTNIHIIGSGRLTAQSVTGLPANTSGQASTAAIWFHKVTDSTIEGITVDNILYTVTGGEITDVRQYGIMLTESNRNVIDRVKIEYVGNDCISIRRDSSFNRVQNCLGKESKYGHSLGQDASGSGLIFGSAGGVAEGNQWVGNTVIGNRSVNTFQQGGIVAHGTRYPLIQGNAINDCGDGVVIIGDTKGYVVDGNTINEPVAYGIVVLSSDTASLTDGIISNNLIQFATGGGSEYGIYLWATNFDLTGTTIVGNTIVGSDGSSQNGIYLNGAGSINITDTKISNNFIRNVGTGVFADTTNSGATIGRTWVESNHFRECVKSVRIAEATAAGTISTGKVVNNDITSTKNSGIGIELDGVTYYTVSGNRVAVSGTSAIAFQELNSATNNQIGINRFVLSTTSTPTVTSQGYMYYDGGLLALNTSIPQSTVGGLDISSGGIGLVVGADSSASTRTNSTTKVSRVVQPHYTNAEEPVVLFVGSSTSTTGILNLGGGSAVANTCTEVRAYTAANNTTLTGTLRFTIDSAGVFKLSNADSAPGSNPTGGGYLYCEAGALKYRGSSGTVTTIANA